MRLFCLKVHFRVFLHKPIQKLEVIIADVHKKQLFMINLHNAYLILANGRNFHKRDKIKTSLTLCPKREIFLKPVLNNLTLVKKQDPVKYFLPYFRLLVEQSQKIIPRYRWLDK